MGKATYRQYWKPVARLFRAASRHWGLRPSRVGAVIERLAADSLSHTEVLDASGVVFADSEHTIDVVAADQTDAQALGCVEGTGLLREIRRATDPAGVPLLWSEDRFLPGTVSFAVHNSASVSSLARRRGIR